MLKMLRNVGSMMLMSMAFAANAQETSGEYWTCRAIDSAAATVTANAQYQRQAVIAAIDACKKSSSVPMSCKSAPDMCHVNNPANLWRCTSFDVIGGTWRGNYVASREAAISSSQRTCHSLSFSPNTCTVQLITCVVKEKSA